MCHLKDKHSGPCVAISIRDENKGKGVGGEACLKSWRDDGLSSFSISRLDMFYEPITPDDVLLWVNAGTQHGLVHLWIHN